MKSEVRRHADMTVWKCTAELRLGYVQVWLDVSGVKGKKTGVWCIYRGDIAMIGVDVPSWRHAYGMYLWTMVSWTAALNMILIGRKREEGEREREREGGGGQRDSGAERKRERERVEERRGGRERQADRDKREGGGGGEKGRKCYERDIVWEGVRCRDDTNERKVKTSRLTSSSKTVHKRQFQSRPEKRRSSKRCGPVEDKRPSVLWPVAEKGQ